MAETYVPTLRPAVALGAFSGALGEGELEQCTAYFTREACLITADGTGVHGPEAIAVVLAELIEAGTHLDIEAVEIHEAGELASAAVSWQVREGEAASPTSAQRCEPTIVMRNTDAGWRIAILAPWGLPSRPHPPAASRRPAFERRASR